jgi:hypothetical protein
MEDKSYIGSGNILIREFGAAAPFVEIGNCSALTLSPQEDVKQLQDFTKPGGGLRNQVRRVSGVDVAYTFHDFSAENFARGLRAAIASIAAGTITDELAVAYKGGYTPLARIATAITTVAAARRSRPVPTTSCATASSTSRTPRPSPTRWPAPRTSRSPTRTRPRRRSRRW